MTKRAHSPNPTEKAPNKRSLLVSSTRMSEKPATPASPATLMCMLLKEV
jgi:hypothetical protein